MTEVKIQRCAIYTRKSTEEGLELEFNSLHAQREACEAYVLSQRSEGWTVVATAYDDGGYSGGNLDRPALASLLSDIERGEVDVVVVYKIDRLTRSLADFAKIVERFERRGISFVSVTQAFNTTTSMGRLTLNVLLSFAQFEREVTSERIRDKISASKRKGMWVGGPVPAGYNAVAKKLVISEQEARLVRSIFERYVKCRNLRTLERTLRAEGTVSKVFVSRRGNKRGGVPYSCGALHHMLRNRIYLGEIPHRGEFVPGQHQPIIERKIFESAQKILDRNHRQRVDNPMTKMRFPLRGLVFDDKGHRMSPVRQRQDNGGFRRYYVSQALLKGRKLDAGSIARVPAQSLEEFVEDRVRRLAETDVDGPRRQFGALAEASNVLERIEIRAQSIVLTILVPRPPSSRSLSKTDRRKAERNLDTIRRRLPPTDQLEMIDDQRARIVIAVRLKFRGGEKRVIASAEVLASAAAKPDRHLVKAVARATRWRDLLSGGTVTTTEAIARREGITRAYVRAVLPLAFLAPDLTHALLTGRHPPGLTIDRLVRLDIPCSWKAQRNLFEQVSR